MDIKALISEIKKVQDEVIKKLEEVATYDSSDKFLQSVILTHLSNLQQSQYMVEKLYLRYQILTGKLPKEEAVKLTCYENLAFCCDISRSCVFRDEALNLLGIDKEEYSKIKKKFGEDFIKNFKKYKNNK